MAPHREEMVEPQLGQREPRVILGEGEATQILAQETEMDKQIKKDLIKMALMEYLRIRTEEVLAPGHRLQLVTQSALATPSVSTTNALRFRTRHLVVPPPTASYVFCGDKRHQPVSQGLPALITSVYLLMDLSTAAHQASIAQSTTLAYKTRV